MSRLKILVILAHVCYFYMFAQAVKISFIATRTWESIMKLTGEESVVESNTSRIKIAFTAPLAP